MDDQTRNLFRAVKLNDPYLVSKAIVSGADIRAKNSMGHGILHYAASRRKEIAEILMDMGAEVNVLDFWGNSPLHLAVCECNLGVARLYIERGAGIDARDGDGNTPLHQAAVHGSREGAELLTNAGADLAARNNAGKRPLDVARGGIRKFLEKAMELAEMRNAAKAFSSWQNRAQIALIRPSAVQLPVPWKPRQMGSRF